ncbi:MAG: DUF3604 domain-containing protein [Myxococcota bacterium]|nr:DUF3604 domain-containing protein [Myxococcota bacterium]
MALAGTVEEECVGASEDIVRRSGHPPVGGICVLVLLGLLLSAGCDGGPRQEEMKSQGAAKPPAVVAAGLEEQRAAISQWEDRVESGERGAAAKQILFGDLHVHSTFSQDAFIFSLPLIGGEGAHPPADACDFARYCANLDFFALTDHAEALSPEHYEVSKESIRQCNARSGDSKNPDLVAFMGFEWSQAGLTPESHYGHRCLIFRETADDLLPKRPIASEDKRRGILAMAGSLAKLRYADPLHWGQYTDFVAYAEALQVAPSCEEGVPSDELPPGCFEVAETPGALHRKLDEWGGDVLEIPHGMAWGVYTPATSTIDKHLAPENYDADKMRLVEIMSGHGNSEEYRPWREWEIDEEGRRICSEPTENFLPCCWQAGEIMRGRCAGLDEDECERRVALARQYATEAYTRVNRVFPDADPEEWLDCDQCRDCFKPSFSYRPRESVQYGMSLALPEVTDEDGKPLRFRYGFVGSSDEHSSRPGVGYKNYNRGLMTDVNKTPEGGVASMIGGSAMEDPQMPIRPGTEQVGVSGNDGRTSAFLYPGGLAAVHSESRSREDVWEAMGRREVYGTSGPRILLWFDLLNTPEPGSGRSPMGSQLEMAVAPEFEVRALGSFEPRPGCPDWAREGLSPERITRLCQNECYFPGDERRSIAAIEIVRILPRTSLEESADDLIEDPWLRHECDPSPGGCVFRFSDDEFSGLGRDALYYARALEEAQPGILGRPLRPQRDESGKVVSVEVCSTGDDCRDPVQERAWSSPIFVDHPASRLSLARMGGK